MSKLAIFLIGLFIGAIVGIVSISLCQAAKRGDEQMGKDVE